MVRFVRTHIVAISAINPPEAQQHSATAVELIDNHGSTDLQFEDSSIYVWATDTAEAYVGSSGSAAPVKFIRTRVDAASMSGARGLEIFQPGATLIDSEVNVQAVAGGLAIECRNGALILDGTTVNNQSTTLAAILYTGHELSILRSQLHSGAPGLAFGGDHPISVTIESSIIRAPIQDFPDSGEVPPSQLTVTTSQLSGPITLENTNATCTGSVDANLAPLPAHCTER